MLFSLLSVAPQSVPTAQATVVKVPIILFTSKDSRAKHWDENLLAQGGQEVTG